MAQKTFTFTQKPKVLDENPEAMANRIRVGDLVFTMKNFMPWIGHDDSMPYRATLYVDNIPLCTCFNDGWGGETELKAFGNTIQAERSLNNISHIVEQYKWKYGSTENTLRLHFIADILAETCSLSK